MCDPVTLTVMAVATTAAGLYTQAKSADAQEDAIREQLASTEEEIVDSEAAEINDRMRAARKEQGRIKVAAGEAGLQLGGSVEMLLKDSLMQASLSNERTMQNGDRQVRAARSEANSMLSRIQKPTVLGAGLQLVSAGASTYAGAKAAQINKKAASGAAASAAG